MCQWDGIKMFVKALLMLSRMFFAVGNVIFLLQAT
jgi:hypothetical protein